MPRGAPWEAGRRQELGSQQPEKRHPATAVPAASPGPAVPAPRPRVEPPWDLLTGPLLLGVEDEGRDSRRGSSSAALRPRGGARLGLRRSLLAAVGRAALTRGAAPCPSGGVKAADRTHFQRDIRPCRLTDPGRLRSGRSPARRPGPPPPSCAGRRAGASPEAQGAWRAASGVCVAGAVRAHETQTPTSTRAPCTRALGH